jgi:hypothetical protein
LRNARADRAFGVSRYQSEYQESALTAGAVDTFAAMLASIADWDWVTISQLAVAVGTVILAYSTWGMARAASKQADATADMVKDRRGATPRRAPTVGGNNPIRRWPLTLTSPVAWPMTTGRSWSTSGTSALLKGALLDPIPGQLVRAELVDSVVEGSGVITVYFKPATHPRNGDEWWLRVAYEGPSAGVQRELIARLRNSSGRIVVEGRRDS